MKSADERLKELLAWIDEEVYRLELEAKEDNLSEFETGSYAGRIDLLRQLRNKLASEVGER